MNTKIRIILPSNVSYLRDAIVSEFGDDEKIIVKANFIRFNNGEGKCILDGDVEDSHVYIISDTNNYSCTYDLRGQKHILSPDEHFQDIKRAISALRGEADEINVIMPMMYQSRQDKRRGYESMDCAMAIQELRLYGVKRIITFDVHNKCIDNASGASINFLNSSVINNVVEKLLNTEKTIDPNKLVVVSPDLGAFEKVRTVCEHFSLQKSGFFIKERDYTMVSGGKNPIKSHQFIGPSSLTGHDVIVVDDMIASGGSLLKAADTLKKIGARQIYFAVTFSLFTEGITPFCDAYKARLFSKVYTSNLTYIPDEIQKTKVVEVCDCSKEITNLIKAIEK